MSPELRTALETWLALEHEAVWWSGTIGGAFDDLRDLALVSYDAHRAARDALVALLGAGAPGPELGYGAVPSSAEQARAAAADVEQRLAAATVTVLGLSDRDGREVAMAALRRAALAALDWDADPVAFPGLS